MEYGFDSGSMGEFRHDVGIPASCGHSDSM